MRTRRPEAWYVCARSNTASTMPNTAVLAPMPSARMSTMAAVNRGLRRSDRSASKRSPIILTN